MAAILDREALERFVPHKGTMFLLDRLISVDTAACRLESEVDIKPEGLFFHPEHDGVPVWVAFEYMAQSIAAYSGHERVAATGGKPKVGFIMGVRDFECAAAVFKRGQVLRVGVHQEFRDGAVVCFRCRVADAASGAELVSAMINAIEVDDDELKNFSEGQHG